MALRLPGRRSAGTPPDTTGAQDVTARNCSTDGVSTGRRRVVRWRNANQTPVSQRSGTRTPARAYSPIRIPQQRFDGREPCRTSTGSGCGTTGAVPRHTVGSTALGSCVSQNIMCYGT